MKRSTLSTIAILLLTGIIHGCAAVVVGGAVVTATVVHDRRTLGVLTEDQSIEFKAADALAADPDLEENSHINVTSYNRVALMTGQTSNQELKARAERLVAGIDQVRRVVNELEIGSTASLGERTGDTALVAKIKFKLSGIDIPDFDPLRVKIIAERGNIYLMGLLTQAEADATADLVSHVSGVRRVVKVFEYF